MAYFTVKQVEKAIGNEYLNLYKGEGYYYFIYDSIVDPVIGDGLYGSYTVGGVMYLNGMPKEHWVAIGKRFAAHIEAGGRDVDFHG